MVTVTIILLLCAIVSLLAHAMKPNTVPLWVSVLFVIVAMLITVLPIK